MAFSLDLTKYWNKKEILVSVIFSRIKTFFEEKWKLNLFEYIKYIKNNDWIFTIKTSKPIVNAEFKLYLEELLFIITETCFVFGLKYKEIKIIFK